MANLKNIENLNKNYIKETKKILSNLMDYTSQKKVQKKINSIID